MGSEEIAMQEAMALLVAAKCHRENLEGICSAMVRNGEKGLPGARALAREIETLAGAVEKLQKMIEGERE